MTMPPEPTYREKRYLGDSVYVEFDGYDIVLTTEDGRRATNRIVMEPEVYAALLEFVKNNGSHPGNDTVAQDDR